VWRRLGYLELDLLAGGLPLLAAAIWGRKALARHWGALGISMVLSMAFSVLAERGAGSQRLWLASPAHTTGLRWLGVPWEEWLSLVEIAAGLTIFVIALERGSRGLQ
jgi:hypothetical protein